jgi:hypothetical protein
MRIACLISVLACSVAVLADPAAPSSAPATTQAAVRAFCPGNLTTPWPNFGWPTLAWFGAVATLALTFRPKPLLSLRNLDALVLSGMCVLLSMRDAGGGPCPEVHPWGWWGHSGLAGAGVYWVIRGIGLLASNKPTSHPGTISGGVRFVLVLAGLALAIHQIATAPISPGSRDGVVGGEFTAASGKLPYGDAPGYDRRSPLVYLIHAGVVRLLEPHATTADGAEPVTACCGNHEPWLTNAPLDSADITLARLINGALFVLMGLGLYLIGSRFQAEGGGWLLVALFCVFPGTLECLPRPEVMLPACLLTWTFALALVPGIGGLLAMVCLVLAGVAWPWAWLALPVLLAYFWRRGWQALGSSVGLVGAAAGCVCGLMHLVQPALPHAAGALALAGLPPTYGAHAVGTETVVIDRRETDATPPAAALSQRLWRQLVTAESATIKSATASGELHVDWPNGVNGDEVLFRDVEPTDEARPQLQRAYRDALRTVAPLPRVCIAARTVLEATWPLAMLLPRTTGWWQVLADSPTLEGRWLWARRATKGVVALLVLWATLVIFFGRRTQPRHLLGALLLTVSGVVLASETGAAANLALLVPLIVPLWALYEPNQPPTVPRAAVRPTLTSFEAPPVVQPPPPRITLEPERPRTTP